MIRHGTAPFLECSTRGERRLSAFNARPSTLNGDSIEAAYQAMKTFDCVPCRASPMPDCLRCGGTGTITNLHWSMAKGMKPTNAKECAAAYTEWWRTYIREHADLLALIRSASGLSDMFGQPGHVCQATVLWEIRNDPTF